MTAWLIRGPDFNRLISDIELILASVDWGIEKYFLSREPILLKSWIKAFKERSQN